MRRNALCHPTSSKAGGNRQPPTANRQPPTANRQPPTANRIRWTLDPTRASVAHPRNAASSARCMISGRRNRRLKEMLGKLGAEIGALVIAAAALALDIPAQAQALQVGVL